MYSIYCVTNKLNNKSYIGQSVNVEKRWKDHTDNLNYSYKKFAFQNAIVKYGPDNFIWQVIEEFETLDECNDAEEFYVAYFNTLAPNGYNLLPGGNNRKCHESTKKKISETLKTTGSFVGKKGPAHPNYGKKLSAARIAKLVINNSGDNCTIKKINSTIAREIYLEYINNQTKIIDLVTKFGIAKNSIRNILNKKSWKKALEDLPAIKFYPKGSPAKLNKNEILEIRELYSNKIYSINKLSKLYSASYSTIKNIVTNKICKYYL